MSIVIDGMDQHVTQFPGFKDNRKEVPMTNFIVPTHVTGNELHRPTSMT